MRMSREGSVSRPDFCTASFKRSSSMACRLLTQSARRNGVAAVAVGQEACDTPDGRHTDTGELVNLTVGQATLQILDHAPSIRHGLYFGGRAQIPQECPALVSRLQGREHGVQVPFRQSLLARGDVPMGLHDVPM